MEVLVWDGDDMNFHRYHESKNLFDKNNADIYPSTNVSAETNSWNAYTGVAKTVRIPCSANTTYAISIDSAIEQTIFRGILINSNDIPEIGTPVSGTVAISSSDDNTAVFTTLSDTKYIVFQFSANIFDDAMDSLMFNAGSQPLPYEPYDSEVWHDTPYYIMGTDTDTITTPADIYANDTTATVGLKGNMQQSGTPSPSSPVMPQECGERTGNLFDINSAYVSPITVQNNVATGTSFQFYYQKIQVPTTYAGQTLTFSAHIVREAEGNRTANVAVKQGNTITNGNVITIEGDSTVTFTADNDTSLFIAYNAGDTIQTTISNAMLSTGSAPLPYEPYGAYKIPILSNSTTTNVYLGEVQSTRKIGKCILTGNEDYSRYDEDRHVFRVTNTSAGISRLAGTSGICTQFERISSQADLADGQFSFGTAYIYFRIDSITYNPDFIAYIQGQYAAGTPVTIWYVLAEPTTGIVNEPIRKIGAYADEVSGISIPVTAGANTLSIGTTLKPSEVSVNYHGWHPVSAVHEKSKNLFDKDNFTFGTGATIVYVPIYVGEGTFTLSTNFPYNSTKDVFLLSGNVSTGASSQYNGVCEGAPMSRESTDGYLTIATRYNTNRENPANYDYMLNTGSTALPYEPYWT